MRYCFVLFSILCCLSCKQSKEQQQPEAADSIQLQGFYYFREGLHFFKACNAQDSLRLELPESLSTNLQTLWQLEHPGDSGLPPLYVRLKGLQDSAQHFKVTQILSRRPLRAEDCYGKAEDYFPVDTLAPLAVEDFLKDHLPVFLIVEDRDSAGTMTIRWHSDLAEASELRQRLEESINLQQAYLAHMLALTAYWYTQQQRDFQRASWIIEDAASREFFGKVDITASQAADFMQQTGTSGSATVELRHGNTPQSLTYPLPNLNSSLSLQQFRQVAEQYPLQSMGEVQAGELIE